MTPNQIKIAEDISTALLRENRSVYTKVVSLVQAKTIQGLRAVFDEVAYACRLEYTSGYALLILL